MKQLTVAIDFDGTIAKYDGFKGKGIFGHPIENVSEVLNKMKKDGCIIIVHTTRSETDAVKDYLDFWGIPCDYINHNPVNIELGCNLGKPLADIYIDDRAIRFEGDWLATYAQILKFKKEIK